LFLIRLSPDKRVYTIVLPVFIAAGENAESALRGLVSAIELPNGKA